MATYNTPQPSAGERVPAGVDFSWRKWASCTAEDMTLFFPPEPGDELFRDNFVQLGKETVARYEQARKICMDCAVRPECLEWAMTYPEKFGMWGGSTPEERNAERRRQNHRNSNARKTAKRRAAKAAEDKEMAASA